MTPLPPTSPGFRRVLASLAIALVMCANLGHAAQDGRGKPTPTLRVAPDLEVIAVEFGGFTVNPVTGRSTFTKQDTVSMVEGKGFGWRMKVRTTRRQVEWKEIFHIPQAPASWGMAPNITLSSDRRTATTVTTQTPDRQGWIYNTWIFAKGDPLGTYQFTVHLDDKPVATHQLSIR